MGCWHSIYYEALLVRLASMAVVFVVLVPVLWILLNNGFRLATRFVRLMRQRTRLGHWHLS